MRFALVLVVGMVLGCGGNAFTDAANPIDGDDAGRAMAAADDAPGSVPVEAASSGSSGGSSVEAATSSGSSSGSSSDGGSGDAGAGDASADSGTCITDLSNVVGDFHIGFDVLATGSDAATVTDGPLLEQRSTCDQYSPHWLVAEQAAHIIVQFYDGSGGATLQSVATVADGVWHHVGVAQVSGTLSISIDAQLDNSTPMTWSPGTLSLLQVGRSVCAAPYAGQVSGVCLTRP